MSEERRIVCWVQLVIGCTSWEAPESIKTLYISPQRKQKKKKSSSEIVDKKKKKKNKKYYHKKEEKKKKTQKTSESQCIDKDFERTCT